MALLYQQLMGVTLSDWGSFASIAGFLATVCVVLTIKNIRRYYVIRARVPGLAQRLRKAASNLAGYLNNLQSFSNDVAVELASIEAMLESLRRVLRGEYSRTVAALLKDVGNARKGPSETSVRAVYTDLVKLNEQIRNLQDELTWER